MVLLFTDIVASVAMKRRLGDAGYLDLLTRHNAFFTQAMKIAPGGAIVKNTGDGFLARFDTPADAVRVALAFQSALHHSSWPDEPVRVRIAIHAGTAIELSDAAGQADISGFAVDLAARVTKLALPGQILLTRQCFNDARQYVREHPACEPGREPPTLHWLAHGPYILKGNEDEPLEVFEVGASSIAPLDPPPDSEGARRSVPAGDEEMYGWRPAPGLQVPRYEGWTLQRRLGAGGYGEVWLAENRRMREQRVFKFCFDADRLRSFKRELTLFRLLREALGDRRDIARLYNVNLERPPFYLESEYSPLGDLYQWAGHQGGIAEVPVATRFDLLARIAEGVSAAHSIGVLHKDLKPNNVLIEQSEDGSPRPKITDFGVGVLADRSQLQGRNITIGGFTVTQMTQNDSSRTGSPMYMPPETLGRMTPDAQGGKPTPFTAQGDVYALGVMLYQMTIGDFDRPLAQGWERDLDSSVEDPVRREVLRDDIAHMVDGDPKHRLTSAGEVAARVHSLDQRCAQLRAEQDEHAARQRAEAQARLAESKRQNTRRIAIASTLVLVVLLTITAWFLWRERGLRQLADQREEETERIAAFQAEMLSDIDLAAMGGRLRRGVFDERLAIVQKRGADAEAMEAARTALDAALEGINFTDLALATLDETLFDRALKAIDEQFAPQPLVQARLLNTIAYTMMNLGLIDRAMPPQQRALDIRKRVLGEDDPATLLSMNNMALLLQEQGRLEDAEPYCRAALDGRRRVLGDDHPDTITSINNMGYLLLAKGEFAEAEPYYEEAIERSRRALGEEDPETMTAIANMGYLRQMQDRLDEAEPYYRESLDRRRRVLGNEHRDTLQSLNNMAGLLMAQGKITEAEPLAREALAGYRKAFGNDHPDTLTLINNIAGLLDAQGKLEEAEPLLRESLEGRRRVLGNDHPATISVMSNLSGVLRELGQLDEAERLGAEAVARARTTLPPGHWYTGVFLSHYGGVLMKMQRFADAEPVLLEAYDIVSTAMGESHQRTTDIVHLIEECYKQWDAAEPGQGYDGKAAQWRAKLEPPEPTEAEQP